MSKKKMVGPVFIVGVPRSGTTLIRNRLNSHTKISIAPEIHFFNHWWKRYKDFDLSESSDFNQFWEVFTNSERFKYLDIDAKDVLNDLNAQSNRSFKTLFQSVLKVYAQKSNKNVYGEKTPANFLYVDKIFSWYPNAKVIWVIRDPRAVSSSYLDVPWQKYGLIVPTRKWNKSIKIHSRFVNSHKLMTVKFEEFLKHESKILTEIFSFLGLDELLEKTNNYDNQKDLRTGWAHEHFKKADQEIDLKSIDKWKGKLSYREIIFIENFNKESMEKFGYSSTYNRNIDGLVYLYEFIKRHIILLYNLITNERELIYKKIFSDVR